MPINANIENLVTLSEAAKLLPKTNGKRINVSTLWRWCRKGLRGVTLEYTRVGSKIATSPEALGRFFSALAEADAMQSSSDQPTRFEHRRRSGKERQRAVAEADAILVKAGIVQPSIQKDVVMVEAGR